jgi:hypothetical protein
VPRIERRPSRYYNCAVDEAMARLVETILDALTRGDVVEPVALTFLLRCYAATDRADIRQALEPALARSLDDQRLATTVPERAAWLVLFSNALAVSADDRVYDTAASLAGSLSREWGHSFDVAPGAVSVDACLLASRAVDLGPLIQGAIDELERLVGAAYRPGEGLAPRGDPRAGAGGGLADHVALSSALLNGYIVTGRLPYSMLAEELMQFARRMLWNDEAGRFADDTLDGADTFRLNCDAARVLCGLAALHADVDYRGAAVIRADATYEHDAHRILSAQETGSRVSVAAGGFYGLALQDWLGLREIEDSRLKSED